MQMSLARALTELKMTVKKIEDTFSAAERTNRPLYVGMKRKKDLIVGATAYNVDDFNSYAKGNFDTINNLVERRRLLKLAISNANNTTKVTVCGKEMTISEAIFYRQTIDDRKKIADRLKTEVGKFIVENEKNDKQIDVQITEIAKTSTTNEKKKNVDEETLKLLQASIGEPLRLEKIDPIDAEATAKTYLDEYERYKTEIDFALSEINARTLIEVAIDKI